MSKKIIQNYIQIKSDILKLSSTTNFIVVSKNQPANLIEDIIKLGHIHFGENKLQESLSKWPNLKILYPNVKLHFIGPIQTNKVIGIFNIFDYIHSLDSKRLVDAFSAQEIKLKKKLKYFIQINIDNEVQKRGIHISDLASFISYCNSANLNLIGLMCIPPVNLDPIPFFKKMQELKLINNLNELSMGMSVDYKQAINYGATYIRIGSAIFK